MIWDYRVMRNKQGKYGDYSIHEVFYDEKKKILGWTHDVSEPVGDNVDELKVDLQRMLMAFDEPVLDHRTGKPIKNKMIQSKMACQ